LKTAPVALFIYKRPDLTRQVLKQIYLASPELAELKAQFLRGEKPEKCIRCWEDEDNGLASRRHYLNGDIDPSRFDFDEPMPLWITALHSTTCNLACRICDSNSSSKWATENRKFDILPTDNWDKTYHHFKNEGHMNELVRLSSNLHKFTWYGGEPLLAGQKGEVRRDGYVVVVHNRSLM